MGTKKRDGKVYNHRISRINGTSSCNLVLDSLRALDLIYNKHIPQQYKTASVKDRFELLAGLLDTDGHLSTHAYPKYEITQKNQQLAEDIAFLARSLGFAVTIKPKKAHCFVNGVKRVGDYFRVNISGNLSRIPMRIERKKSTFDSTRNFLNTNFTVTPIGEGEYFGFSVDGDHLFLLANFIVTHNSWWLTHCGKQALLHGKKVAHISLEMNDEQVGTRYLQSLYALTTRNIKNIKTMKLRKERGFDYTILPEEDRCLKEESVLEHIAERLNQEHYIDKNLWVKKFPTRSIGVNGIKAYLDSLEAHHDFIPDLLIIDYADLLKVDTDNYRHSLSAIYQDLHGLADERNIMLCTATQSNREGAQAKVMQDYHISEDFSKIHIADLVIMYSQTDAEKALGLARLNVTNARNEEDNFQILITQSYAIGQFALEAEEHSEYWQTQLKQLLKDEAGEDEEQETNGRNGYKSRQKKAVR